MRKTSVCILVLSLVMLASTLVRSDWAALWPEAGPSPEAAVRASTHAAHRITLGLRSGGDGSHVSIVLNGKAVATFSKGPVTLYVTEGDHIEIDSSVPEKVRVFVQEASAEILLPRAGDSISIQNTLETLGRIYLRRRSG